MLARQSGVRGTVTCPEDLSCQAGECRPADEPGVVDEGGSGSGGGNGNEAGSAGESGGSGTGGAGQDEDAGGSGCACRTGGDRGDGDDAAWFLLPPLLWLGRGRGRHQPRGSTR